MIFLGDSGVGKTSFIRRVVRNEFDEKLSSTVGKYFAIYSFLCKIEIYSVKFPFSLLVYVFLYRMNSCFKDSSTQTNYIYIC